MAGAFGAPSMPSATPIAAPQITNAAANQAAQQQRFLASQAAGNASTIMTSGQGVPGVAPVARKTLLGA